MEASSQLHTVVSLLPGKEYPLPPE